MSIFYDSLFNGASKAPPAELQAEFDRLTAKAEAKLALMTEEEKLAEFARIMGMDKEQADETQI